MSDTATTQEDTGSVIDRVIKDKKKHNDGAADLEKVTDHVEEQEMSEQDITNMMKMVLGKKAEEASAKAAHEKALSKIKVPAESVDLIANELEIPKVKAERKLKEHNGDVVAALTELVNC